MDENDIIQTYSGNVWHFNDISRNTIDIESIAHSIGMICRWNGQTIDFLSVGQHSCNVFDQVLWDTQDMRKAGQGLVHDVPETIYGDMTRPLKRRCPDYSALLEEAEHYIFGLMGFPEELYPEVVTVDNRMLSTEYIQCMDLYTQKRLKVMLDFAKEWPAYEKRGEWDLSKSWTPRRAEAEFMKRWDMYVKWARKEKVPIPFLDS